MSSEPRPLGGVLRNDAEGHVDEVEVDTCPACGGVWLDKGELTEAKRRLDVQRLEGAAGPGFRDFLTRI